ncbi:hypothetical protein D9757_009992 [Collybiopsis confluens]|uniref:HIT-type domain-containing protein n=1 Tax=Collybiopsis confluens TaxID=2823264 RepID=A0A8H5GUZ2_9AGAR|nr:hypothetical protein D9757_009992 [Collybiopsis confluens]
MSQRKGRKEIVTCQVCNQADSKYTCSACFLPYCSVACYKNHKNEDESRCTGSVAKKAPASSSNLGLAEPISPIIPEVSLETTPSVAEENLPSETSPLRPLTSLRWPYISDEEPAYPDPLERNDPKPLRLRHYEAIASSTSVRKALFTPPLVPNQPDQPNQRLRNLLASIDKLSGVERERALQRALGVGDGRIDVGLEQGPQSLQVLPEDTVALRALAEAIENAVRGNGDNNMTLGLDWDQSR